MAAVDDCAHRNEHDLQLFGEKRTPNVDDGVDDDAGVVVMGSSNRRRWRMRMRMERERKTNTESQPQPNGTAKHGTARHSGVK